MIGKKIKARREELNLSQEQLAKLLGVGKSAISNYENNISSPKETIMYKLFDALKCDANFFYEDFLTNIEDFNVSNHEKNHIQKYRTLDEHGKKMVDFTLNEEYERCITEVEAKQKGENLRKISEILNEHAYIAADEGGVEEIERKPNLHKISELIDD